MFSNAEKQMIAAEIENLLLKLNHPEMPKEKPKFMLIVSGKERWSYAQIEPNWIFNGDNKEPGVNPWNEIARDIMK